MSADSTNIDKSNRNVMLSALWIFVTVNYIYCDVITLMNAEELKQIMTGTVGSIQLTQGFLLGAAILLEIPMVMIILSRVLRYSINRWVNIIAGIIMTAAQVSSLFMGTSPTLHYVFFSVIEISCDLFIVWYAWTWLKPVENPALT
jgi:hypothetical protein